MTAGEKIAAAVAHLESRGVARPTAGPPMWRLLWRVGLQVPPPHFLPFLALVALNGVPFGVFMTAVFVLVTLLPFGVVPPVVRLVPLSGVAFGALLAGYYRWSAWRLGLPRWAEFEPDPAAADADDAW